MPPARRGVPDRAIADFFLDVCYVHSYPHSCPGTSITHIRIASITPIRTLVCRYVPPRSHIGFITSVGHRYHNHTSFLSAFVCAPVGHNLTPESYPHSPTGGFLTPIRTAPITPMCLLSYCSSAGGHVRTSLFELVIYVIRSIE